MRIIHSVFQKMVEYYYQDRNNLGQVFMFHQITDVHSKHLASPLCLEKQEFYKFIQLLTNHGTIKSIEQLGYCGKASDYYLTFDDGHINAYDHALSWLSDSKIPFTVFVTLNYLDHPGYISTEQLRLLAQNKYCTVGSHTITHPLLRFINDEELKNEIVTSKIKLESITGTKIDYFAYPGGSQYACSGRAIKVAEHAGYKKAFSTFSMALNDVYMQKNQYFIPRINVDHCLVKKMEDYYASYR